MPSFPIFVRPLLLGALLPWLGACASQQPAKTAAKAAPAAIEVPSIQRPSGETPQWWFRAGAAQAALASAQANTRGQRARNVIVFLGDGMSLTTIAAAHVLAGQRKGVDGESYRLSFEQLPFSALSRTYETDLQTPDSAGTMTAIMSGVKTRGGYIGVSQVTAPRDCAGTRGEELVSALELAAAAGMSTGVVTTARITHATPAATYGHLPERDWEVDAAMTPQARAQGCTDFAAQLVDFPLAGGLTVAMGGGRRAFLAKNQADPEYPAQSGKRLDGRNLVAEWTSRHPDGKYIWNAAQLQALDLSSTPRLLGLFEPSHMNYEHDRPKDGAGEPSLAEMTTAALDVLQRNPGGFFLMVEGGRIDHALHSGNAYRALDETISLADAVQAALDHTDPAETLIVVTADHSHTLTFIGYPKRGNPILGKTTAYSEDGEGGDPGLALDASGLPYTTLGFANGPGYTGASDKQPEGPKRFPHEPKRYSASKGRPDLTHVDTTDPDYMQEAAVPLGGETHGGENVAIYALGPGAAAFHGEIEQNVIFHIIAQHTPRIRAQLCKLGSCNADGVPVDRPTRQTWLQQAGAPPPAR